MRVNHRNGAFSGTIKTPGDNRVRPFAGVLLQHQNAGTGQLLYGGRTGKVTLTPQ
jgi:hypothetical protein